MSEVPHHDHPRIEKDLNGFGRRVGEVEKTLSSNETTTNRNKEDIANITKLVGKNAESIAHVDKSLAKLTGKVTGAVGVIMVLIEVGKHFLGK